MRSFLYALSAFLCYSSSCSHFKTQTFKMYFLRQFCVHYENYENTLTYIKNVKWSRYRPGVAQRVGRDIALLFHDAALKVGEWSAVRPGCILPPGKTRYPFYRRLGEPQCRSGWVKNLVPTGIRSLDRPGCNSVAIPTELPGPPINIYGFRKSEELFLISGGKKRVFIDILVAIMFAVGLQPNTAVLRASLTWDAALHTHEHNQTAI